MANTLLKSSDLEAFFENVALMLSVGVQTDEAVHMLADNSESRPLENVCREIYHGLACGQKLSVAMEESHYFPSYACEMVAAGERTGRIEATLNSLAVFYDEEERLIDKIRSSVTYPTILLCVMSVVLAFVVAAILPVFINVYDSMSGGLSNSSFGMVEGGIVLGWIALIATLACTVFALVMLLSSRSASGRERVMKIIEKMPGGKHVFYTLALSRFTSTLSVYMASGSNSDDAVGSALRSVENPDLYIRVEDAHNEMIEPIRAKGFIQAMADSAVFDPFHIRLMTFGMRSGRLDKVLDNMSEDLFADAINGFDDLVDRLEPILSTFVAVAVCLTLISVMLPLIGMMASIS